MAGLGGMLAAAILKVVADQIGSAIGGQIKLQKNFDKELNKMKMALESVDALLEDAGRRSITDKATLLWLKRLKDAMYAISDMIDEFEADTEAISHPSARKLSFKKYLAIMIPCLIIGPKITMANRMEKMREDLEVITEQHGKFKLTEGTNANDLKVTGIWGTSSNLEPEIIGRTDEKDKVLSSLLHSMTQAITILPIYGIGGLGKTTLAKMVYNSSQFKGYSQVWVYVSQTFDLKNIGNSIISQLSEKKKESKYIDMQMIESSLQKLLAGKKVLIVVDDLWEGDEFHLESLKNMLMVGKGSNVVVIITTRDERIAKKICTIQPYKLAQLTDDMCWSIIKQKSSFESRDDKEQLENIGRAIAVKCGGVALAAKSLGLTLKSKETAGEWKSVRDSNIWTISSLSDTPSTQVLSSLKLSYSDMPPYLKLCFAYCAIFPKGHKIVKADLIHHWVSLGFSTWQLGERYISQLLGLSFLEYLKSPSTIQLYDEDITLLTMHDLVHDLARSVMDDEILVAGKGDKIEGSCYHYALVDDCSKPLDLELSKIRALRFVDCDEVKLHDSAFSLAKSLRVLDLSECSIHELPDSIGVLKQLRYLNAPRVQDAIIPNKITRLSKLIYLNLHGSSNILALPESFGEIEGLVYLDLSDCSRIKNLPDSFGRLKELVHMDLSNCTCVGSISVFLGSLTQLQYLDLSYCPNIGELPEALGGLSRLRYLNLSFSSYLECCHEAEVLGALTKLEYLNLSSENCSLRKLPEALGRFTQLKYLNLSGCCHMGKLPSLFGSLKSLVHLDLSKTCVYDLGKALVGLTGLQYLNLEDAYLRSLPGGLTKLRYLNLSKLRAMSPLSFQNLINHICNNLSDLEHLDLSDNSAIKIVPSSICNLRKLHTLDLSRCLSLKDIPDSLSTIDSLKFLYFNGCSSLESMPLLSSSSLSLPAFVVQAGDCDSSSNLGQLQHTDPVVLDINRLQNVKSVAEAHSIKLIEKKNLEELILRWTGNVRFVDDKMLLENLVPPSTLKNLVIDGYNGASFPDWLVMDQLPNLELLVLTGMANLKEWNTSRFNSGKNVIETLKILDCPLLRMKPLPPKAKKWVISNSDNVLSSWEEITVPHINAFSSSSPITFELSVEHCEVPFHQWRLLQHLHGLSYLTIESCYDMTSSPEIIRHLSSVIGLCIEGRHIEQMPQLSDEFTSLKFLKISRCIVLPESMSKITKLQSLDLSNCYDMALLPRWLGELNSLKALFLDNCNALMFLPESIQRLTNLQTLLVRDCRKLRLVAETEKGIMKLTHNQESSSEKKTNNQEGACLLPISLQELEIENCRAIRSLPDGIERLANLKKLEIKRCPELRQWCELVENQIKLAHIEHQDINN